MPIMSSAAANKFLAAKLWNKISDSNSTLSQSDLDLLMNPPFGVSLAELDTSLSPLFQSSLPTVDFRGFLLKSFSVFRELKAGSVTYFLIFSENDPVFFFLKLDAIDANGTTFVAYVCRRHCSPVGVRGEREWLKSRVERLRISTFVNTLASYLWSRVVRSCMAGNT